jgi:CBS domain-containing protein
MQRSPVSIAEEADVASILKVFFVDDFTRVPVIGPGGAVVGTLNRIDVVQAVFERTLEGARP